MNSFTNFLRRGRRDDDFDCFVAYWDQLKRLTIQVYKGHIDVTEAETVFVLVWPWLRENYGLWQDKLEPCWRRTRAAGMLTKTDPSYYRLTFGDCG